MLNIKQNSIVLFSVLAYFHYASPSASAQALPVKSFTNVQNNIQARSDKSQESLNELAVQLIMQGNKQQGLEQLELAHRNDPSNAEVLYNISGCNLADKNYESALASIDKALLITPRDLHFLKRKTEILLSLKRFEAAADVFKSIISIEPRHADSYSKLGAIYGLLSRWQESEASLLQARNLIGDDPTVLNNLASSYLMQKKYQQAIEVLAIAQQKWPTPEREITLGVAFEGLGNRPTAISHYQKAKELGATNEHLESHIQRVSK